VLPQIPSWIQEILFLREGEKGKKERKKRGKMNGMRKGKGQEQTGYFAPFHWLKSRSATGFGSS